MAAPVLVLTESDDLLDDLLRLCSAADARADVVHGGPPPAATWSAAPLVLVGDDWAAARDGLGAPPARRPGVVLVGRDLDDHTVWERGVALGAEQVLHLPDDEARLTDRIADAVETRGAPAVTIGVLAGRGGAGASTLAAALALAGSRVGLPTTLIDGDPLGGGLDVLLGAERTGGPRWPDFVSARGRLSWSALEEALPRPHGVSLLSWNRTTGPPASAEAMRSVLAAARRRGGLVVVDLPRGLDDSTTEALSRLDLGLLVVPTELRAVAAARLTVDTAGALVRDLRLAVRATSSPSLGAPELAQLLGLPLSGEIPDEPGLPASSDAGEPPGRDGRGPLGRFCADVVRHALPPERVPVAPVAGGVPPARGRRRALARHARTTPAAPAKGARVLPGRGSDA
ncbi:septum site-determining protein Ssd [Streptomyces sp. SM14]|uniref:septum site-determining protein Ssd n=1 Tax=Streptomyces sp. SM14 TaxID=1736045 RepID=UPI0021564051|nr:septum site-determining protein Ssd [Streptomyces sp. SM14]